MKKHLPLITLGLVLGFAVGHAAPTNIAITDSSFETPTESNGGIGDFLGSGFLSIPYTSNNPNEVGVKNPGNQEFPNSSSTASDTPLPSPADGLNALFEFAAAGQSTPTLVTYSGNLGDFIAGDTYTLTVAVGDGSFTDSPFGMFSADLLSNGGSVKTSTLTPTAAEQGTFQDLSVTYTATQADAGKAIGFDLGLTNIDGTQEEGLFDNVTLTQDAVPEPSSLAFLMVSGVIGLLLLVFRHRFQV
jgi:hypothetical protein